VKTLSFALRRAVLSFTVFTGLAACGSSSNEAPTVKGDGGVTDGPSGEAAAVVPIDTTPIDTTMMSPMTWAWTAVPGAMCRDGSPTGIGLNLNPSSTNLMIYLEGGGACFNSTTCLCAENPSCFNEPGKTGCCSAVGFDTRLGGTEGSQGLFSRSDAANPMKDWNFVYVPFCTGDIHGGNNPDATVPGLTGKQQFVGFENITRDLAKLVPTFKGLTKVVLTGISAGGFGAAVNYPQTAKAFAPVPVYDLDDSGPPMEDPYVPKCLQQKWATLWGFDKTILAECGTDCPDPTNYTLDAVIHTAKAYPNIPFGLVEDTDDSVITLFYGYGANDCADVLLPTPVTGAMFTAGLLDERAKVQAAGLTNTAGFIFQGTTHTSLGSTSTYDSVMAGGGDSGPSVMLSDWVTTLVNSGTVTNVGP
jgi:hypothetical protein